MSSAVQDLLLEWLAWMLIAVVVIASYATVYFVGRAHGRQAQRRATVRTAIDDAIAETVVIPRPRAEPDR